MSREKKLRSILTLIQRAQAERHTLGDEILVAQMAGEDVFQSDSELSAIAEINGRLTSEISVYAGLLTNLVGDPSDITKERTQILYDAQQRAGECQCHSCRVKRQKRAQ